MRQRGRTSIGSAIGAALACLALVLAGWLPGAGQAMAAQTAAQNPSQVQPLGEVQAGRLEYKEYSNARVVRLSLAEGDVQVLRPEEEGWQEAMVNLPIQQGYVIATNEGRAEIEFESGATARLAPDSMLEFAELALADGARITRMHLSRGTGSFYANLGKRDVFTVETPTVTAVAKDSSRFRVGVEADGSGISVYKGEVSVQAPQGSYKVKKDRQLFFRNGEEQVAESRAVQDEWDRWSNDREDELQRSRQASSQYVSGSNYSYGVGDLNSYGYWQSLPGYGNVWRPRGVSLGWTPYFDGRWMFVSGYGWTWMSFEPWGWLPYHFGRWAFTPHFGWVWLPGYWNSGWHPGYVHWVRYNDRIGWCPVGPNERPGRWDGRRDRRVIITHERWGGDHRDPRDTTRRITLRGDERIDILDRMPRKLDGIGDVDDYEKSVRRATVRGERTPGGITRGIQPPPGRSPIIVDPRTGIARERKMGGMPMESPERRVGGTGGVTPSGNPSRTPERRNNGMRGEGPTERPPTGGGPSGTPPPTRVQPRETPPPRTVPPPRVDPRPTPPSERSSPPPRVTPPPERSSPPPRVEPRSAPPERSAPPPRAEPRQAPPPPPPQRAEPRPPPPPPRGQSFRSSSGSSPRIQPMQRSTPSNSNRVSPPSSSSRQQSSTGSGRQGRSGRNK